MISNRQGDRTAPANIEYGNTATAIRLARQLGIPRVIVPLLSGIFCAVGMLACDVEHPALATVTTGLDTMSANDLRDIKARLQTDVAHRLAADGYPADRTDFLWEADLRHEGQASELTVPFAGENLVAFRCHDIRLVFHPDPRLDTRYRSTAADDRDGMGRCHRGPVAGLARMARNRRPLVLLA